MGGKVDWLAAGLPTVRAPAGERRALEAMDPNPPTCTLSTPLRDLPAATLVVVVDDHGIVQGRVGVDRGEDLGRSAQDVMRPGPATVRAHELLDPLLERMRGRRVEEILVTTPEGQLLGVVRAT